VPEAEHQILEALRITDLELSILPNTDKPSKPLKQTWAFIVGNQADPDSKPTIF